MQPSLQNVIDQAMQLPVDSRAILIEQLVESLSDEEVVEHRRAWMNEAARRLKEIEDGTAKLIPGDQVMAEARRAAGR